MIYEKLRSLGLSRPGLHIFAGEYGSAKLLLLASTIYSLREEGVECVYALVDEGIKPFAKIKEVKTVSIKDYGFLGQEFLSKLIVAFPDAKAFVIAGQGLSESTDFSLMKSIAQMHNISVVVSCYVWNIDKESLELAAIRQLQHHIKAIDTLVLCSHSNVDGNQVHKFWLSSSTSPEVNEYKDEIFAYNASQLREDLESQI